MNLSAMVKTPAKGDINTGLSPIAHSTMMELFGKPGSLTKDCSAITNPTLKSLIVVRSVGAFKVSGLKAATDSLAEIMAKVKQARPDLYHEVKTAGMLCCRAVRRPNGSSSSHYSNHSWGCAVDLFFGSRIDEQGDGKTQAGLLALYPFFHAAGWYWGAEFSNEDSMHFEVADETIRLWAKKGLLK